MKGAATSGGEEIATQPVPISGKGIIAVRCSFESMGNRRFKVPCNPVSRDEQGNESIVTTLAAGTTLEWLVPEALESARVSDMIRHSEANSVSQVWEIVLENDEPIKMQFSMKAKEVGVAGEKVMHDTVYLPFSVRSYGLVLQSPRHFIPTTETVGVSGGVGGIAQTAIGFRSNANATLIQTPAAAPKSGYQNTGLDPKEIAFNNIRGGCFMGKKLLFTSFNFIYMKEKDENGKDTIRLFAGSGNDSNIANFADRMQVRLGQALYLACTADAAYVSDAEWNRILRIPNVGPVELLVGKHVPLRTQFGAETYPDGPVTAETQVVGPQGLVVTGEGNVLFTELYKQRIRKLSRKADRTWELSTIAGCSTGEVGCVVNPSPTAANAIQATNLYLNRPKDLALSSTGEIFFSVYPDNAIYRIDKAGIISTFAEGLMGNGVTIGPDGAVYATDSTRILRFPMTASGRGVGTVVAGGGVYSDPDGTYPPLNIGENGPPRQAMLRSPQQVFFSPEGELHIADFGNYRVFRITRTESGEKIETVVGRGPIDKTFLDSPTPAAKTFLNRPLGLSMDDEGTLYLADTYHGVVRRIRKDSNNVDMIETFGPRLKPTVTNNAVVAPLALGVSADGKVFVADQGDNGGAEEIKNTMRIKVLDANSAVTIAGDRSDVDFSGAHDGPALLTGFSWVRAMNVGPDGKIYLVDDFHGEVRRLTPTGNDYTSDVIVSGLRSPGGVAVNGASEVFIADTMNQRVLKFSGGQLTTLAGIMSQEGYTESAEDASQAILNRPTSIAVDSRGVVYFVEKGNTMIRMLEPKTSGGYRLKTLAGNKSAGECGTGVLENKASAGTLNRQVDASLSVLCMGVPLAITVRDTCHLTDGKIRIAYSQTFDVDTVSTTPSGSIVKVERPCAAD